MRRDELIAALRRLRVETGSLACIGCGREYNCGAQGCVILRAAVEELERDPWIRVAERLPEIPEDGICSRDVFVTDGESIMTAQLWREIDGKDDWPYVGLGPITHWCETADLLPGEVSK